MVYDTSRIIRILEEVEPAKPWIQDRFEYKIKPYDPDTGKIEFIVFDEKDYLDDPDFLAEIREERAKAKAKQAFKDKNDPENFNFDYYYCAVDKNGILHVYDARTDKEENTDKVYDGICYTYE